MADKYCRECGTTLPKGSKFCLNCGTPLTSPAPAGAPPSQAPKPPGWWRRRTPAQKAGMIAGIVVVLVVIGAVVGTQAWGDGNEPTTQAAVVEVEAESTTTSPTTSVVPTTAATPSVYSTTTLTSEPSTSTLTVPPTTTPAPTTTLTTVSTTTETQAPPTTGGTITTGLVIGPSNGVILGITPNWSRYEDDYYSYILYFGHCEPQYWPGVPDYTRMYGDTGGSARIVFKGTCARLVCVKDNHSGYARISLDGATYLAYLYSPNVSMETISGSEVVWTSPYVADGYHELVIETMGGANPAAAQANDVGIDAVEVVGYVVPQ